MQAPRIEGKGVSSLSRCSFFASLVPTSSSAEAAGLYETRIFVGCNIPWGDPPSPVTQMYGYSFGGNGWGFQGQVDPYTDIYIDGDWVTRADESFNVTSSTWTSNTWTGCSQVSRLSNSNQGSTSTTVMERSSARPGLRALRMRPSPFRTFENEGRPHGTFRSTHLVRRTI